jgi:transposase-like protein
MQLDESLLKNYVESNGLVCPHCGGSHIAALGDPYLPHDYAENPVCLQEVECHSCESSWVDEYAMSGMRDFKPGAARVAS